MQKHLNCDLVPIRNIYYTWGQDNFKVSILSPYKKLWQWGSCPHQKYLLSMGTSKFSKSLSCPHPKIISIGILSQSEIFTKHGEKIISKVSILSPFIKYLNGDLVPFKIFTKHGDTLIFKVSILSPIKKHLMGILSLSKICIGTR